MIIFLLLSILILAFFLIGTNFFNSAKRNLFKDQAAWSAKDIIIKRRSSKENLSSKENDNYLEIIADESKVYLENEYKIEEE